MRERANGRVSLNDSAEKNETNDWYHDDISLCCCLLFPFHPQATTVRLWSQPEDEMAAILLFRQRPI
jgi:hypothetical protein